VEVLATACGASMMSWRADLDVCVGTVVLFVARGGWFLDTRYTPTSCSNCSETSRGREKVRGAGCECGRGRVRRKSNRPKASTITEKIRIRSRPGKAKGGDCRWADLKRNS